MPSPVDIDDIHDYYEAQSLKAFFDQAIRKDKARKAAEQGDVKTTRAPSWPPF